MKALADPVGYVERNGGLQTFLQAQLVDTGGPVPTSTTPTPAPVAPMTPAPGTLSQVTPAGMQYTSPAHGYQPTPAPGTLQQVPGMAPGHVPTPFPLEPAKNKTPLIIGIIVALLAIGGGAAFMLMGGGGDDAKGDDSGQLAGVDDNNTPPEKPPEPLPEKPPEPPPEKPPEPPPEKPPEVVEVVKVTLTVNTRPKGAMVFVGKERKPRGTTPLDLEFDKSDEAVDIRIVRRRYKDEKHTFVPVASKAFEIELSRKRSSGSRPSGTTGGQSGGTTGGDDSDGVVSPF